MSSQQTQSTQKTGPKVVATIPCFNTERSIRDIICRTKKYVDQVLVIDDGSHDGTAEAARIYFSEEDKKEILARIDGILDSGQFERS